MPPNLKPEANSADLFVVGQGLKQVSHLQSGGKSGRRSFRSQLFLLVLLVLIPAFVVSELIRAFALGFAIYLPFLVIDLVVANVLLALGMQMLNPTQISLPFKLLLFVAIDGWGLLAQTLVTGYKF